MLVLNPGEVYVYHGIWRVIYRNTLNCYHIFERYPDGLRIRCSTRTVEQDIKQIKAVGPDELGSTATQ